MDHECLNMANRMVACNQHMVLKKQKYHFMHLKCAINLYINLLFIKDLQ